MRIEVVSDVVCPWCFVGKRRLEQALAIVRGGAPGGAADLHVTWKPYELHPDLPREGVDRAFEVAADRLRVPTPRAHAR